VYYNTEKSVKQKTNFSALYQNSLYFILVILHVFTNKLQKAKLLSTYGTPYEC